MLLHIFARLDDADGHVVDLLLRVVGEFFEILVDFFEEQPAALEFGLKHCSLFIEEESVLEVFEPVAELKLDEVGGSGVLAFELPGLDVFVFEVVGVVHVDELPELVDVEELRQLLPLLVNQRQQLEVAFDLFLPVGDVDGFFESLFPNACGLSAVSGDVSEYEIEVLVGVQHLQELHPPPEQQFV